MRSKTREKTEHREYVIENIDIIIFVDPLFAIATFFVCWRSPVNVKHR